MHGDVERIHVCGVWDELELEKGRRIVADSKSREQAECPRNKGRVIVPRRHSLMDVFVPPGD